MGFTRNSLDQTCEQFLEILYVSCEMNVEVVQYQTSLLIVHVSCWQTNLFVFPLKYSLQHFKLYKRNSALRSFEIKLFGMTNTTKWVTPNIRFFNKLFYHCYYYYLTFGSCEFMLALIQRRKLKLPYSIFPFFMVVKNQNHSFTRFSTHA